MSRKTKPKRRQRAIGRTYRDEIGELMGLDFVNFESEQYKIEGLCRERGRESLDLLAIISQKPGKGNFRRFMEACQREYATVGVWHINNPIVGDALKRWGFTPASLFYQGDHVPGMRWSRAALQLWLTLEVDVVNGVVNVLGVQKSAEQAAEREKASKQPYVRSFGFMDQSFGHVCREWLKTCGMADTVATETVREIGRQMLKVFDKRKEKRRG